MFLKKLDEFIQTLSQEENELDEWYLSDFSDKNISSMESHEAFYSLKLVIPYLFQYPQYGYELLDIMYRLKRQADTTEPFCEESVWNSLSELYQGNKYAIDLMKQITK